MLIKYKILLLIPILIIDLLPLGSEAACDCGSTDANTPCTGLSIFVSVTAGTPNNGIAVNSEYTWAFHSGGGDARCGQFANGDYWVAPAAGQTSVTIASITSNGSVSADVDPIPESMGLMSGSKNYGNYNSAENIIPKLPMSLTTTSSIVAAVQRNEAIEGNCGTSAIVGACIDSYNVVTILSSVPDNAGAHSIRPNITGQTKKMLKLSDFDLSKIPGKNFLAGPTTTKLEDIRKRWSHSTEIFGVFNSVSASGWSEGGRAFRSHTLIDDYGAGAGVAFSNDLMHLFSNDLSLDAKTQAFAAMLTYGHDIFKAVYDPPAGVTRWFGVGASQSSGRFLPAVLFAALLRNTTHKDLIKKAGVEGQDLASVGPHELTQIHHGKNNRAVWGDVIYGDQEEAAYWGNLFISQCYDGATGTCTTTNGKRTGRDPHGYIDGPPNKPGAGYLTSTLGPQRALLATMFLIPDVCEAVNSQMLIDYIDRTNKSGLITIDDPCVTPDKRESVTDCTPYPSGAGCKYYKVTWGPDPANPGDCLKAPTPPYTKVGRFTALNGNSIGVAYPTSQVESNWEIIRGSSPTCQLSVPIPSNFIVSPTKISN